MYIYIYVYLYFFQFSSKERIACRCSAGVFGVCCWTLALAFALAFAFAFATGAVSASGAFARSSKLFKAGRFPTGPPEKAEPGPRSADPPSKWPNASGVVSMVLSAVAVTCVVSRWDIFPPNEHQKRTDSSSSGQSGSGWGVLFVMMVSIFFLLTIEIVFHSKLVGIKLFIWWPFLGKFWKIDRCSFQRLAKSTTAHLCNGQQLTVVLKLTCLRTGDAKRGFHVFNVLLAGHPLT